MDYAYLIKNNVSMQDILDSYGYEQKKGFICCPFHNEDTPSCKIYKDSFYCFGCGEHGDAINFVMKVECCSFKSACKIIDSKFSLGIFKGSTDEKEIIKLSKKKKEEDEKKNKIKRLKKKRESILKKYILLDRYIEENKPLFKCDKLDKKFLFAIKNIEYFSYLLDDIDNKLYVLKEGLK